MPPLRDPMPLHAPRHLATPERSPAVRRSAAVIMFVFIGLVGYSSTSTADERSQQSFFEQKIRPVLIEHCYACHSAQADKLKGGLLLDSKSGWQNGGDSAAPVIVAGQPDESLLIQYVRYADGLEMPPSGKLPDAIIADLETWIREGAFDPRTEATSVAIRGDKSWWSLQPLRHFDQLPEQPDPQAGAAIIDDFVATQLARQGLDRNPPADARTLVRRMYYDVVGLPPTPQQVHEFTVAFADDAQAATSALVDRLLASPHYGEQWGRHWLDVVRFGESIGFERNVITEDLWPFRDYVIRSLNEDKPFDRFFIEHLAGDVVGHGDPQVEVGTAFLVAGPYDDVGNQDVVAQANIRAATLDEIITATSGAFLGLTVNCARCHNHKFDPIPAEDYYRLRAALEGTHHGRRVVATAEQKRQHAELQQPLNAQKADLEAQLAKLEATIVERATEQLKQRQYARPVVDPQLTEDTFPSVSARFVKWILLASSDNPRSAVGARLVEVEVWTAEDQPQNVARATAGGRATGARSMIAEDFPEAYGPQFTIDGQYGQQWFIGHPAELTIELAQPQSIDRVAFCNAKGEGIQDLAQGATPCEYQVLVSDDGQQWQKVADSFDRTPWSPAHGVERVRAEITTTQEAEQLHALRSQLAAVNAKLNAIAPLPTVWVGNPAQPTQPTHLHIGGDPMKPGDVVLPSSLDVLSGTTTPFTLEVDAPEAERRLALAKWITATDNPLTPRVLANRIWQYHFGTGIVDTPSDFGFLGGRPTHPELLDWLATQLVRHGWQLKPLHRQILLSHTYRQSSRVRDEAAAIDKDSRQLWRFPPRRLTAEEIRDSFLMIAGKLNGIGSAEAVARAGGPGFRLYKLTQNNVCTYFPLDQHGPETYRRAVYHQNARASVVDLLSDFDLPDVAFAAPVRANTTTPLQALTMLNHQFTLDMAQALSERAASEANSADPQRIVATMMQLVLQREPTDAERDAALALWEQHGGPALGRALLNLNEVLYVE